MKPKVLVTVLVGPEREHWITPGLAMRLIEAARLKDVDVDIKPVFGIQGIAQARNIAVEMMLQSNADFLCMCDNDTIPPANFIPRVLDFAQSRPDVDVVALPYYIRTPIDNPGNGLLCVGRRAEEEHYYHLATQLASGWHEIDAGGTGCVFIRRSVFSALKSAWFHTPTHIPGATEDFYFCEQAKRAGFHIWTNGDLLCGHLHTVDLAAVALATVARTQEDMEIMQRLGIPTTRKVKLRP